MKRYTYDGITVFQSALFQTTTTVVERDEFILITDPNTLPAEIAEIQQHVESVKGKKPCFLLFTHGDFDHIIGYRAFPEATVIGSSGLLDHPEKEKKLQLIRDFDLQYYIQRDYPVEFPAPDIIVSEDGQELKVGTAKLTFYKAPGHTADGIYTVIEPGGIFLAGDYLSDFELPFIYDSAKHYMETIKKAGHILDKHSIQLLVPGHGQPTSCKDEMLRRINRSIDYLERLKRAVVTGENFTIDRMATEHGFSSPSTDEVHTENVQIMRKEWLAE